tara:strand:+ start:1192 stop:1419 length:228 start_codon:yes stop_codon:yes gene_type:complete
MSWGIWLEDLETWLVQSYTKNSKGDTYTANPALWDKASEAKKEAKELNTMWRGRKPVYQAKEYKVSRSRKKTKRS